MRLLRQSNDGTVCLDDPRFDSVPNYAILSHTWLGDDEEVTYQDMETGCAQEKQSGYSKILFCIQQAAKDGLEYSWVDTCCIDKSSSAELQEAITSMFKWYRNAAKCYVYLTDVSAPIGNYHDDLDSRQAWETSFCNSRWFTRGWTLQELLAPRCVEFFTSQGVRLGDKTSLERLIHLATGIPLEALRGANMTTFSVAERMSWAETRTTKRREDMAYSLLGIFNVFLPLLYGEGDNALVRLRKKIEKKQAKGLRQTELLSKLPHVEQAAFNAVANQYAPICLPDTRVELLRELTGWIEGSGSERIFWLSGVAGTGKSTVARTIASKYHDKGYLGASFFFSKGGGELSSAAKLITTLARQLATNMPHLKRFICEAILECDNIGSQSFRDQWDRIILKPLSKLGSSHSTEPIVIVLDALDECGSEKDVRIMIRLLGMTGSLTNVRLRVLVTSRPEIPVRCGFSQIPESERQVFVLQDVLPAIVNRDLGLFFEHSFADIREERGFDNNWPGKQVIERLVEITAGLFIWAATACRFIREGRRLAMRRISLLINHHSPGNGPQKQLDKIYTMVLKGSIEQSYSDEEKKELCGMLRDVMGGIVILYSPLPIVSLSNLSSLSPYEVRDTLADLHAIISVPEQPEQPIRLHHPSFRDFILSRDRCTDTYFLVDEKEAHLNMAKNCIGLMLRLLKKNICGLQSPGTTVKDVNPGTIKKHISPELEYACRHWAQHLRESGLRLRDKDQAHQFFQKCFLNWLEVMSLTGNMVEVAGIVRMYSSMLVPEDNKLQLPLVYDARRLIFAFQSIIELSPLQSYCAALVFISPTNTLQKHFWSDIRPWIQDVTLAEAINNTAKKRLTGQTFFFNDMEFTPDGRQLLSGTVDEVVRIWDVGSRTKVGTLDGSKDKLTSVSVSPDGTLVAGASDDTTVVVWVLETRTVRFVLRGHTRWINSVAFSPDGKLLVSGSMDETVRIWSAESGKQLAVLEGNLQCINSVVFSPDGKTVAGCSTDQVVRLWDVKTNEISQLLDGHSGAVNHIRYIPNGQRLVSAADDSTVKVWNSATGVVQMTLEGHQRRVMTVAVTSDGGLIASGSEDMTIILWDAATGALRSTLQGHVSGINAIAFSPDDRLLASCSFDDEVRLWNVETGESLGEFEEFGVDDIPSLREKLGALQIKASAAEATKLKGHSATVTAMTLSNDEKLIATGSRDRSIKVWTNDGARRWEFKGHTDTINSLAFSPDQKSLASASADRTAKVWSTETGYIQYTIDGHSDNVRAVCFSPDGKLVASCSTDKTAIIWEAKSGLLMRRCEGHLDTVNDIQFSPIDPRLVATCSADTTVRLWHTDKWTEPTDALEGHSDTVNSVSFSPGGTLLASASADTTVRMWKLDGSSLGTLKGHTRPVNSAAFSSDNKLVVSCSDDETVRIWDADKQLERGVLKLSVALRSVRFSPSGQHIESDRGLLDFNSMLFTPPSSPIQVSRPVQASPQASLFVSKEWITKGGEKVLWLPAEYTATCVETLAGSVVMGHATGGVTFVTI